MFPGCFSKPEEIFKEKRRVYQQGAPALPGAPESSWYHEIPILGPGFKFLGSAMDLLNAGASATAILAASAARLSNSFANLIDLATYGLAKGTAESIDGVKRLVNWIRNHKEMQDPLDLPEYIVVQGRYLGVQPTHADSTVQAYMRYEYQMATLDILLGQLKTFFQPIMDQLVILNQEVERRSRLEYDTREERARLKKEVESYDGLLKDGALQDAATNARYRVNRALAQRSLNYLESQCSLTDVELQMPQLQMTEFPIGSGKYLPRFVPNSSQKSKVDLNKMVRRLSVYAKMSEPYLKTYVLEKAKLVYRREQISESKANKPALDSNKNDISAYEKLLNDKVAVARREGDAAFAKQTPNPEPIYDLINDSFQLRRAAVSTPIMAREYVIWKNLKKMPDKLKNFGCYAGNNSAGQYGIYKLAPNGLAFEFLIRQDGTISTQYPNNVIRDLPNGADPNNKKAWNPQMP